MKSVDVCINNKLIIYISTFLTCLMGIFCIYIMPVAPFPSVDTNSISIKLNYPGANAQTVEQQVTSKIVTGLQSIKDIQQITSNSQAGAANINLILHSTLPEDILQTQMQIIQAIASSNIPSVVSQPQININKGTSSLMSLVLTSDKASLFEMKNFIHAVLLPKFNSLPDVLVSTSDADPVVKIKLNPEEIAKYKLNPVSISQMLDATYQSNPLGSLAIANQQYILNMQDNFQTLTALENIIVDYQRADSFSKRDLVLGQPIYLKNIAQISFEPRSIIPADAFKVNGENAVMLSLDTSAKANPFSIAEETKEYLQSIASSLPNNIKIKSVFDMSTIMKESITGVVETIVIASILVFLITLIFLGRLRTTLLPIVTIPVCLLGAMIFVYLFGFTINLITLLALVIAVGLVVDDSIVVMENITRYLEKGMKKHQAVLHGTADISLTIIGITLTLLAVYFPIFFLSGGIVSFFQSFALTLAAAVFISGLAALTLTPVMSMALLNDKPLNQYQIKFDRSLEIIINKYHHLLSKVLRRRILSLTTIIILVIIGGYYALKLPKMVFPNDPNKIISINIVGSLQDNLQSIENKLKQFTAFYQNKMLALHTTAVSKDQTSGFLKGQANLIVHDEYLKKTYPFANQIRQFIKDKNLENTYVQVLNVNNWGGDYDLSFYVYGGSSTNLTNLSAEKITRLMKQSEMFSFVTNQINQPQKQLMFDVHQVKAASLGILLQPISQLLSTYYGGYTLNNYFNIQGLTVPIIVELNNDDLTDPTALQKLMIQSPITNEYYPMNTFVSLQTVAQPLTISTFNGQPAVEIDANLNSHYSIADAISYVNQLMRENLPSTQYQYTDNALQYLQNNHETLFVSIVGIICVYFLLSMLFKNLIDPFIIILTVPFSVIGGAMTLYLIGGSINLYSTLGLITLIGLITKHGVLIVQFANQELKKGQSVIESILTSTRHRFRPIMMTTLAMIFGALPLVFSSSIFYVARQNLGITIIGGLIIGTLFSLFIIPLVYVLVKNAEIAN